MKYHELNVKPSRKANRVGRGIAGGQGKTAGRGTKGQGARAGSSKRPGFEGGQNPLMQRLPKLPGFKSHKPSNQNVSTGQLEELKVKVIDANVLAETGLITSPYEKVKLLNKGELSKALNVKLPAASAAAIEAVQKAGGSFEKVARLSRPAKTGPKKS
jgi:large subunit ribosomal protein L15